MIQDSSPITPPPELVQQWFLGARAMPVNQWVTDVATQSAHWGADQELDACCADIRALYGKLRAESFRAARRPKPPSLKPMADYQEYTFQAPPKPKGWWVIGKSHWGQIQFAVYVKPNRLHQLMTKILLGWDWLDND
jgi:hypothetical protein